MPRGPKFVQYSAADMLDGVQFLSPWEELAYRRLCDLIYKVGGPLPDDQAKLSRMTKTGKRWPHVREALIANDKIFLTDDGRIMNRRCVRELGKVADFFAQKSDAGYESAATGKSLKNLKQYRTPVRQSFGNGPNPAKSPAEPVDNSENTLNGGRLEAGVGFSTPCNPLTDMKVAPNGAPNDHRTKGVNLEREEESKILRGGLGRCAPSERDASAGAEPPAATSNGHDPAERRDAGERDALTAEERVEVGARFEELVATLKGGMPRQNGVRDPAAYKRAVRDSKRDAWLRELHEWASKRFDGEKRTHAWEAIDAAIQAGSRDATPKPVRRLVDDLDKLYRAEQPQHEAAK